MTMNTGTSCAYIKELFTPDIIHHLARVELRYFPTQKTMKKGQHQSRSSGANIEYAEHREYVAGDDLRRIDWKVLGRQDRLSIKLQHEEETMPVNIFIDVSASMRYPALVAREPRQKIEQALFIGLGIGFLFLSKKDKVRIHFFTDQVEFDSAPLPRSFNDLAACLDRVPVPASSDFNRIFEQISEYITPGSLTVLITDAIGDEEVISRGLRMLAAKKNVIAAAPGTTGLAHILSRAEVELDRTLPVVYRDSESAGELMIDPLIIRQQFGRRLRQFQETVAMAAAENGCLYTRLFSEDNYRDNFFRFTRNFIND